ncbi:MAG: DNA repair protein RecO [Candidatus Doudnabacteria bacterium]|nr:DNA repair protein RecO [Candidatus Doudnabacteria bacterium]
MKYNKLTGIVLKKQNYKEADQIVTIWTREAGKVRVMARGLRLGKSKLSFSMQDLSLVDFETAGRKSLPALISAKSTKTYSKLRDDLTKTVAAFYATELMLKITADEQPNPEAYDLLEGFFNYLNTKDISEQPIYSIVDSFSLRLLNTLGFSIEHAQTTFNLPANLNSTLTLLAECNYEELPSIGLNEIVAKQSHTVVKNFIEFILERNIKSEQLLSV